MRSPTTPGIVRAMLTIVWQFQHQKNQRKSQGFLERFINIWPRKELRYQEHSEIEDGWSYPASSSGPEIWYSSPQGHGCKNPQETQVCPADKTKQSMSQCRKYVLKCKGVAKPNSIAAEDCPNLVKFFWAGNASQEQNRSHTLKSTMVRKMDIPVLSKYVYMGTG